MQLTLSQAMLCSTCGVTPHRRQRPNQDLGWFESDTVIVCDCETCCECGEASSVLVFPWEALPTFDGYNYDCDYSPDEQWIEDWTYGPLPYGDFDTSVCGLKNQNQRYCGDCYRKYHKDNPIINPVVAPKCKICYVADCEQHYPGDWYQKCYWCTMFRSTRKDQCQTCNGTYTVKLDRSINEDQSTPKACPYCECNRKRKSDLGSIGMTMDLLHTLNLHQLRGLCHRLQISYSWRQNYKEALISKLARYL